MSKKIKGIFLALTSMLIICTLSVKLWERYPIYLARFADPLPPSATPCPTTACIPDLNDRRIAFSSNRFYHSREIYVMNADGTCVTQLTDFGRHDADSPRWSPDGSQILFELHFDRVLGPGWFDTDLYIVAADGSRVTRLTRRGENFRGHWSPDGSKIAFLSDRDGYESLYVMHADGSHETRLTEIKVWEMRSTERFGGGPDWSPDSTQIAFTGLHSEQDQSEVYLIDADGSSLTNLTNDPAIDELVTWLPRENKILFTSRPTMDDNRALYAMDTDGTNVQRIIDIESSPSMCGWVPTSTLQLILTDGAWIYILDVACALEPPPRAGTESMPKECYHQFIEPHYRQSSMVYPYWSSDDPQILFYVVRTRHDGSNIVVTNFDGTGVTNLTNCSAQNDDPDWSP